MVKFLLFLLIFVGCSLYKPKEYPRPSIDPPKSFSIGSSKYRVEEDWWKAFEDPQLNSLVEKVLADNFEVKAAVARLKQAEEVLTLSRSSLFPSVFATGSASRTRTEITEPTIINGNFELPPRKNYDGDVSGGGALDYEIDLWGRNLSALGAAGKRLNGELYLLRQVKLVQISALIELYFEAVRLKNLLELLEEQIQVSEEFLDLTELRFQLGRGNAVDVFQQRASLAQLRSLMPSTRRDLRIALNAINVLCGTSPEKTTADDIPSTIKSPPEIGPLPAPASLLEWRPDVYSSRLFLEAAEYDIAQAVAERLPQLTLNLSANFSADRFADLFTLEVFRIGSDLALPLIDGGRRRAEVRRRQAIADELLANYTASYLDALRDVEDALVSMKEQKEVVRLIENETLFSDQALNEARSRYVNGLSDYLAVLIELQRLQGAQRRLIQEQTNYSIARNRLATSLGGVNLVKTK